MIALTHPGKQFTSHEFSAELTKLEQHNNLFFIIGGPLGLDKSILERANFTLSLSPMTFTHQMARIILEEQIYRAFMIKEGRKYHY